MSAVHCSSLRSCSTRSIRRLRRRAAVALRLRLTAIAPAYAAPRAGTRRIALPPERSAPERPLLEHQPVEPLAHAPVAGCVGVEPVGKVADVVGTEEVRPGQQVQVRVARRPPRRDDLRLEPRMRRRVSAPTGSSAARSTTQHCPARIDHGRPRVILGNRARDGRDRARRGRRDGGHGSCRASRGRPGRTCARASCRR